ncbi:hypothetical protein B0I35DRAFT_411512 [Stachybotrys elegans]|uniref:Ecp2 effector protein domain-containing protein n=1 Tax=Stachybotrys elegans TaxID=80388 RepID=A0A8K0SKZ5_9HYPO|nr:hypothetical protein B0I35DRAFT_411512 [Stachybotrys elegans]
MRLDITAFVALLAGTAYADRLETRSYCNNIGVCNTSGWFYTDFGRYEVNANEGCRRTSVPGMTDFCMDWGKKRGHFKFSHQSSKRCLVMTWENGDRVALLPAKARSPVPIQTGLFPSGPMFDHRKGSSVKDCASSGHDLVSRQCATLAASNKNGYVSTMLAWLQGSLAIVGNGNLPGFQVDWRPG